MALGLAVVAGVGLGLALGGRLSRLAELRLRALGLFYAALALQVVAFPFAFLPWRTGEATAKTLWLCSYVLLAVAAAANRGLRGAPVVALGMSLNLAAIVANGGSMPALPRAVHDAGMSYDVYRNSVSSSAPSLPWLVDRWAAPDWLPLANVYSPGDVVIALGAVLLAAAATGASVRRSRGPAATTSRPA